jgi:hypothetical protein
MAKKKLGCSGRDDSFGVGENKAKRGQTRKKGAMEQRSLRDTRPGLGVVSFSAAGGRCFRWLTSEESPKEKSR